MIPIVLDFVTIASVVAGGILLWLNLRAWRRSRAVITNYDQSEDRKDIAAEPPREAESFMPWSSVLFDDPIDLPDGDKLITLGDAATYITNLPKAEQKAQEWQAAARWLIAAAKGQDYSLMHIRIEILRALYRREVSPPSNPEP
jgi:hypothetical protein